jgi:hypothetical protein
MASKNAESETNVAARTKFPSCGGVAGNVVDRRGGCRREKRGYRGLKGRLGLLRLPSGDVPNVLIHPQ